jgi:zona occludens toxin
MITLITGQPGAGKTLFALQFVRELAAKEGRPVHFSGIKDLRLPWLELANPEDWYQVPQGSIVVVDEAQRIFRPRGAGAVVPRHVSELETHRHQGIDLFIITQHPMLVDTNVRRLVGRHFHVVRSFGLKRATVHEWNAAKEQCDKSREDSVRHEWSYPQDLFAAYHSAEVHTHKARVPARVFILLSLPLLLAGLVWVVAKWWEKSGSVRPDKPPAAKATATAVESSRTSTGKLSTSDWIAAQRPRVEGLAYTAPVYDDVTKPARAPYPAACLASKVRCRCYSEQGTGLDMPHALCRQIVERGFYMAWDAPAWPSAGAKGVDRGVESVKMGAAAVAAPGETTMTDRGKHDEK